MGRLYHYSMTPKKRPQWLLHILSHINTSYHGYELSTTALYDIRFEIDLCIDKMRGLGKIQSEVHTAFFIDDPITSLVILRGGRPLELFSIR